MVRSLKYNNSLLKKRGQGYDRLKEQLEHRITTHHTPFKEKEYDAAEVRQLREGIKTKMQAERRRNDHVIMIGLLVLAFGIIWLTWGIFFQTRLNHPKIVEDVQAQVTTRKEAEAKFAFYMEDGYYWLAQNKFHNAIFQFEHAVKAHPKDYAANLALTKALLKECKFAAKDCGRAQKRLTKLNYEFPARMENTRKEISALFAGLKI